VIAAALAAAGAAVLAAPAGATAAEQLGTAVAARTAQCPAPCRRDAALTRSIRRALATTAAPGALVGVWQPGRRAYVRSFGVRNTTTRQPMRSDLFMRIGSVTKTFTVTALLQLVDQRKVALDDPISKYVPGVISGDTITLRQLATMRSGLVDYSVVPALDRSVTDDPYQSMTPQQLLSYAIDAPLLFAPGTSFAYSNTNAILLGLVVEQVSGERLGAYITRHITAPLGMRQTSFPTGTALPSPHARGYADATPDRTVANATNWNPSWTWAAGQMVSTLHDLRIWVPRLATGRGLLSAATQRARLRSLAGPETGTYGLGMFSVGGWIGHNGSLPGYQTVALYRPRTRTTIVALINTDIARGGVAPSTAIGEAIREVVSPRNVHRLPASP
jgi:D-alanyl-D-alanine carboxypeptidase